MLRGELVTDGWRSPEVREALDLCLGCKGCASDCPVQVDMATYRSEFLHQHYRRRLRPASHYSMGWLPLTLRLAFPRRLLNRLFRSPAAALLKRIGGIDPRRELPPLATETFERWFRHRTAAPGGREVLLWPDTFTNHLDPAPARAAVELLEQLGYTVRLPDGPVCCGLTWHSTGQLDVARRVLLRSLAALPPALPILGLDPSCTATLREELPRLLGEAAGDVPGRVHTLAEFLDREGVELPRLDGVRAITQTHCHQHAVLGTAADRLLDQRTGLDNQVLAPGCCGLAGNFGFERGHFEVSAALAERDLLPAIRSADETTVLLADGFSCRTQISQLGGGRRAVHLAELLRDALREQRG